MKAADLINKVAGVGLLVVSVLFFVGFADSGDGEFLIPGLLLGTSGMWLLSRREKEGILPDLPARVERLEGALAAAQQELAASQTQIRELTEEREFYRELLTPAPRAQP